MKTKFNLLKNFTFVKDPKFITPEESLNEVLHLIIFFHKNFGFDRSLTIQTGKGAKQVLRYELEPFDETYFAGRGKYNGKV